MILEQIDALLFTLIVILPGFVLIKASDHLLGKSPFRDNFDVTIWSGFLSLLVLFISYIICNIVFSTPTVLNITLITFIVSSVLLGIHIFLIKRDLTKKIRFLIMGHHALKCNPDNSVWDAVLPGYSDYAVVYTSDGMKYCGAVLLYTKGIGKDGISNKELFLHNPILLDQKEELEAYELKGLLLLEQDIKRIEFLGKIKEQENIEQVDKQ